MLINLMNKFVWLRILEVFKAVIKCPNVLSLNFVKQIEVVCIGTSISKNVDQ